MTLWAESTGPPANPSPGSSPPEGADWKTTATNAYTVPIGLAISKVLKLGPLPVKFQLAGQWMPVHPTDFGQVWNLQFSVTPVLPKLIKGNLFDPQSLRFGLGR